MLTIDVQPDLEHFIIGMMFNNGFDQHKYTNMLIEKGIKAELMETFTKDSVYVYMDKLTSTHKSDWKLLKLKETE